MLATFSEDTRNVIKGGFDENGKPLKHNAAFLKELALVSRTINPVHTVVGADGGSIASSVMDEIATIEAKMGDKKSSYWTGPLVDGKNTKEQARLLQLYEWRDNQKKKA